MSRRERESRHVTIPVESWEKVSIRRLLIRALIGGIAGMVAMALVGVALNAVGRGHFPPGILMVSWIVVLVLMIPQAYHHGVCDERVRKMISLGVGGGGSRRSSIFRFGRGKSGLRVHTNREKEEV